MHESLNPYVACITNNEREELLSATLESAAATLDTWQPCPRWVWCGDTTKLTSKNNFFKYRQAYFAESLHITFGEIIETCVQQARDLVYFEDDVVFCKNAMKYMVSLTVPDDVCMVSAFDWRAEFKPTIDAKDFSGIQFVKIPLRTLKLLRELWPNSTEDDPFYDLTLAKLLSGSMVKYLPVSIAQHVGWQSTHGNLRDVFSRTFKPEFDAMELG